MQHYYKTIEGYFDFESTYILEVEKASDGAHFVEVGPWLGKSTIFMAVEIANSGKKIQFDTIDWWRGSPNEGWSVEGSKYKKEDVAYRIFLDNIRTCKDYINVKRGSSFDIVKEYKDSSLDFVFIDSDHSYDCVKSEIINWWPKVKQGGILAGHDYPIEDVARAVHEVLDPLGKITVNYNVWSLSKN
jgi:hypothetical protein